MRVGIARGHKLIWFSLIFFFKREEEEGRRWTFILWAPSVWKWPPASIHGGNKLCSHWPTFERVNWSACSSSRPRNVASFRLFLQTTLQTSRRWGLPPTGTRLRWRRVPYHLIALWTLYQQSFESDSMRSGIRPEKSRRKFQIGQRWRSTPAVFAHFRPNDSSDRLALKQWNDEHFTKNKLMQIWLKSDDNWRNYSHFSIFNSKILTRFQLN